MKKLSAATYPETAEEIQAVYVSRQNRETHPHGAFDNGGRWYPADDERASCCDAIRRPSRAHPYSYMVHCRTRLHIKTWFAEHCQPVKTRDDSIAGMIADGRLVYDHASAHPTHLVFQCANCATCGASLPDVTSEHGYLWRSTLDGSYIGLCHDCNEEAQRI